MCNAVYLPHRFIIRIFLIPFSTEPLLWFISRNETLFARTVIPRLLEATIFFLTTSKENRKRETEQIATTFPSLYIYIYIKHIICIVRQIKVWNEYQRPMTLVNYCNYYNETLDQLMFPRSLFHKLL